MWPVSTAPWVAPLYLPGSHFPFIFSLAPFGHFSFSVCFSITSSILHCFCFFSPFDLMSSKKQVMGAQTAREREICSFVWAVAWFHNSGHWGIFFPSALVLETRKITIFTKNTGVKWIWADPSLGPWEALLLWLCFVALSPDWRCFICIICSAHLVPRLRSLLLCLSIIPFHWRQESRMKWNYRITKRRNQFKQLLKILGTQAWKSIIIFVF